RRNWKGKVGDGDDQIDEAVVVVVSPGARREECLCGNHVLYDLAFRDAGERSTLIVVIEGVLLVVRQEEIGRAVFVVVGPGTTPRVIHVAEAAVANGCEDPVPIVLIEEVREDAVMVAYEQVEIAVIVVVDEGASCRIAEVHHDRVVGDSSEGTIALVA